MVPRAYADKYDDQINALQSEIDQYESQAGQLRTKIGSLQDEIAGIDKQKNIIQRQIDLSQAKYNKLQEQIKQTEKAINDNRIALGDTIADLYVDNAISPLEMLASSKNIGDYVDKQTYRSSVQQKLTQTIGKIKDLKADLEKQRPILKSKRPMFNIRLPTKIIQKKHFLPKKVSVVRCLPKRRVKKALTKTLLQTANQRNCKCNNSNRLPLKRQLLPPVAVTGVRLFFLAQPATPGIHPTVTLTQTLGHTAVPMALEAMALAMAAASVLVMLRGASTRRRATCLRIGETLTTGLRALKTQVIK
jgi:hypothetical protein